MFFRHAAMSSVLASAEMPVSEYERLRQAILLTEGGLGGDFPPAWSTDLQVVEITEGSRHRVGGAVGTKAGFPILGLL